MGNGAVGCRLGRRLRPLAACWRTDRAEPAVGVAGNPAGGGDAPPSCAGPAHRGARWVGRGAKYHPSSRLHPADPRYRRDYRWRPAGFSADGYQGRAVADGPTLGRDAGVNAVRATNHPDCGYNTACAGPAWQVAEDDADQPG